MSEVIVQLPVIYAADPTKGRPVYNGSIYVGLVDTDPEIEANRKQVYLLQESGATIPVDQPIMTGAGGTPMYNGSPVRMTVDGDYSIKILDNNGAQKYYFPSLSGTPVGIAPVSQVVAVYTYDDMTVGGGTSVFNLGIGQSVSSLYINGAYMTPPIDYEVTGQTVTISRELLVGDSCTVVSGNIDGLQAFDGLTALDMISDTNMQVGNYISTVGYSVAGDGGDNLYVVVAGGTGTDDGGSYLDLDNGLQAHGLFPGGAVNVKQFGAVGDGATDDGVSCRAASSYLYYAGGGILSIPAGTYKILRSGSSTTAWGIQSTINIYGDGVGVTTLTCGAETASLISFSGVSDCSINHLSIDCSGQTAGHGIRLASVSGVSCNYLHITNTFGYGIGAQDGGIIDVRLTNLIIEDVGSSGIDIKNINSTNSGILIDNIVVRRFNTRDSAGQAGIDIRGRCVVSNILIEDFGGGAATNIYGIVCHDGEDVFVYGRGAHESEISNVRIFTAAANATGISAAARSCTFSNIIVSGCPVGINVSQRENSFSSIYIKSATTGIILGNSGHASTGRETAMSSVIIRTCDYGINSSENNNSFTGVVIREIASDAITIGAGAFDNSFVSGSTSLVSGSGLVDGGSGTRVVAIAGIADQ